MSSTFFMCNSKKSGCNRKGNEVVALRSFAILSIMMEGRHKKTRATEVALGRRNYFVVVFVIFLTPCLIPLKEALLPFRFFLCIVLIL